MAKARKQQAEAPAADDGKPKLDTLIKMASDAMDLQDSARAEAQKDQDYYDDKQWTDTERKTLEARGQPCLTFNHIKPAVNAIVGIRERSKVDPKAWGRTPKDQDAAEVFTDGLRYVSDVTRFANTKRDALFQLAIWGTTGGLVEVDETGQDLKTCKIDPRDYFYDPFSRALDFSDARYDGIAKWMDVDAVIDMHPDYRAHLTDTLKFAPTVPDSYSDKPTDGNRGWADRGKQRVLLVEMYHKHRGEWWRSVFVWGALLESGPSPYLEFLPGGRKRPKKCTVTQSCYVDRENRRYGVVRAMRGPQDAINKARSKAVHLLNNRQVRVDPGVKDVDEVRKEAARPDGVFEYRAEQFEILNTHTQFAPAHLELLRDAKAEMQRQSPSPGIVGRQASSQSGVAIQREQEAGLTEQAPLLAAFDDWVLRMYRSMADGIKQFWTDAKYIRVTDDEMAPKFVTLNAPEPVIDPQTGQPAIDPMTGQPQMQKHVPAEMDVDIVIDVTPDTAVIQEEQFARLVELKQADPTSIPMEMLIEASSLPKKRVLLDKMKQAQQAQQGMPNPLQIEEAKAQLQLQSKQQMAQIDAQSKMQLAQIDAEAEAQALARQDEYDARKMQRAEALEQMKFQHEIAALKAQEESALIAEARKSALEAQRRVDDLKHLQTTKQVEFDFKAREAEDNAQRQRVTEVQKSKASGEAAVPGLNTLAKSQEKLAAAIEQLSRPKRLVKDPKTGEKRVETVMH